jgi:hypothetical protein
VKEILKTAATIVGLVLATSSLSQERNNESGEQLLFIEPTGWQEVFSDRQENLSTTEYAPAGQDEKNWKELLSIQMLLDQPEADLDLMLTRVVDHLSRECSDFDVKPIALTGVSHQYPTAAVMLLCGASTQNGLGEFSIVRGISGYKNFYLLQKSWRLEPYDTETKIPVDLESRKFWLGYLSYLSVCEEALGNCPQY